AGPGAGSRRLAAPRRDQRHRVPSSQARPGGRAVSGSFLEEPAMTSQVQALFDEDMADTGFVWNVSRLWAHQPRCRKLSPLGLTASDIRSNRWSIVSGILVAATASALGDSYCSLAWGGKLAGASDAGTAAAVLSGSDEG